MTKTTIPILGHVLLTAEAGTLTITGTNLDLQATARVPADIEEAGSVTVPGHALLDLVRKAAEDARIGLRLDAHRVATVISFGRARAVLPSLPPSDFPEFAAAQGFTHRIEVAGTILADMLRRCEFAISSEETRHFLNGVFVHVVEIEGERCLRLVATDGAKLARIDTPRASGLDPAMPGVILPTKTVEMIKQLGLSTGDSPVLLDLSPTLARASAGENAIVSKLVDGTFPDYEAVIPTRFQREVVAPTQALIKAVDFVSTVTTEKVRGIRLAFADDQVAITLRNANEAETRDELDVELAGEPIEIGFNAKFLAEILARTGGDTVRLKLGADAMSPVVIGDKLAEGLFVLMPLRIAPAPITALDREDA